MWSLSRTDRVRTLAIDAVSLPSFCRVNMLKLVSVLVILLTLGVGNVWGATITFNVKGQGSGNSYITTETQYTSGSTTYKLKNWIPNSGQVRGNKSTASQDFYIYNTSAIPGTISGISITGGSYTYSKIYYNTNTSSITSHTTANSMSSASATISNGTGTYFRMNFVNGATSGTQCMTSVTITFCPNPTSLTNGTITASSAQLSWSDSYNTNSYEVYVSTSSTTPAYNATPSATGGSGKSAEVTGLNASTTYNWWVRSKSSSTSKSQWVKGTNFTTSPGSCTEPHHVDVGTQWGWFKGETLSLSATAYSTSGSGSPIDAGDITGYQWYKGGTAEGNKIAGATSATYTKASCTLDDAGDYYCKVSTGATCSTMSSAFGVKIYSLECYTGGTTSYNFTRVGSTQTGTVQIDLAANSSYQFKVRQGSSYYGNKGTITEDENTWEFNGNSDHDGNVTVTTYTAGKFTFTLDYSANGASPILAVTYPARTLYLQLCSDWKAASAKYAIYYWRTATGWSDDFMTATTCDADILYTSIPSWAQNVIFVRFNPSKGSTGNFDVEWNRTGDLALAYNKDYYHTLSKGGDNKYYGTWGTYTVPTYTISYAKGTVPTGGGSISGSRDNESKTCGTAFTLPSSAVFTTTGYTQDGWATEDGGSKDYNLGGSYTTNAAQAFYPHWNANTYTLTWNLNGGTVTTAGTGAAVDATGSPSSSVAFNSDITAPVVEKDGYDFDGWNTTPATKMPAANTTYTAQWSLKSYTVTWYAGGTSAGNITTAGSPTTNVNHGSKVTTLPTNPDGSGCDKVFVGWTNTTSYTHGTSLLFTDAAGSPTITGATNFYAVFATESVATGYTYIGDDGLLEEDETYIFVSSKSTGSAYALKSSDLVTHDGSTTQKGTAVSVTVATGIKVTTENSDLEFTCTSHAAASFDTLCIGATTNQLCINGNGVGKKVRGGARSLYDNTGLYGWNNKVNTYYDVYYNSTSGKFESMASASGRVYAYKKGGTTYSDYTIVCGSCSNEVTVAYTAAPTGGTVAVTKGGTPIAVNGTVKTCTGGASLVVTVTPPTHYSVSGVTFTPSAGLVAGDLSGTSTPASTTAGVWTYNVTIAEDAAGTLTIAPTLVEEAHIAITWNVNGVALSPSPAEGLTWVYSGGDLTALPSEPSVPAGCSGTKVFAGWSAKHSDATEEDASFYDDLFTAVGDAPTGISSEKTFYAVFATSSANPLAGEVMWDEPWTGTSDKTTPTSPSSGATVYNSTALTYAYTDGNTTTQVYADGTMYSGGAAAPELLISKTSPSGVWTVTNIPTGGSAQTELTLSYKTNKTTIAVTSGTSGITIGDATVDGNTYTHTITINHSPSTINNFSLIFTNTGSANARIDDIHLVVPGSGTMTDYVTLCAPSYTITYNKNTEDAVTNLPSPTSVLQSTGSGTLSSTVPERATYTFSGWAETTSGAVAYAAGGSITGVTGDKTLYAVWTKTPVEELFLNYSELNKYVGDPAVTLEVTGVTPEGADATVTWSSNNSTVASVVAATGVVTFGTVGTATITATSTVTGTTTAYCYVTVRNKPTASFTDLIHDGNGTDLSTYHMQNVAGTAIVFPTLDDYATPGDDCDTKHYVFVGWTTSDNNDNPEDNLVASGELEDDQDKVFYAVWADGVEGVSYTKLTTSTFKTSPTKYVIGAIDGDDTFYFYSCAATDANNGNGGCTNAPGTNAPIQFTLSGTADALVATSTEATARYLTPLTAKNFQMSATSKTIQLNDTGTIANPSDDSWTLRFNTSEDYLRWYSSATGNAAYFYEVTAGAAVSYRTSCCTNNVPAPTVVATNTAYTVTLTWAAVVGATGYEVSWNGGAFTAATSPCVKSDLTASTDYTYKVRATYDPLVKCGALVASGNVTTDDVYTVTYSGGTGTGSCSPSGSVAPASYEAGATVTLAPTNSYSLTSNTFAAWVVKDADDNDVPVSNNQFTMPAKNVTVTATWTAVQDKYYDRMHDGTDGSHGGIADGEGKYYLALEGCNYTVPTLTDDDDGDTDCHTTHFKLLGWIAYSHLKTDGSGQIKPGEESYIFQGGGTKSATGATYYAVWAIMTE